MIGRERTKDVACSRLAGVLRQDRTSVTMKQLALMQLDMLAALSEYLEMERDRARTTVTRDASGTGTMLTFTVPVTAVRHRR